MSSKKKPTKRLGRGLDVLLGMEGKTTPPQKVSVDQQTSHSNQGLAQVPLNAIKPNRWQPRQNFDQAPLQSLADSIKQSGLIQPVVLRKINSSNDYELIAGERRWRAAGLAGLSHIPAMVRDIDDYEMAVLALVENLQREDLNSVEQALALNKLISEFQLTHEQAAQYIGQSRSAVTNLLRLLELPPPIQTMLRTNQLQMGHGRAILALPAHEQIPCAKLAVARQWSVREIEEWARHNKSTSNAVNTNQKSKQNADIKHLERALSDYLGVLVSMQHNQANKGKIVLRYTSSEELEGLLERIGIDKP